MCYPMHHHQYPVVVLLNFSLFNTVLSDCSSYSSYATLTNPQCSFFFITDTFNYDEIIYDWIYPTNSSFFFWLFFLIIM